MKQTASVKFIFRRSSRITKIVVAVAVVLSMAALLTLHGAIHSTRDKTADLRSQAIALEQENNRLEQYITEKGTIQEVIRIAKERLGLVEPDSIIIQPE